MVGVFEGELAVLGVTRDEGGEVDLLLTLMVLGDGQRDGHTLGRGQDGQVVLLTIREVLAINAHLADEQISGEWRVESGERDVEGDGGCGAGLEGHGLCELEHRLVRLRIDELQQGLTRQLLLTGVEDAGRDGCLVLLTDKAGHVRLDHHVLLGDSLCLERTIEHLLRMGNAEEAPGGQTLR